MYSSSKNNRKIYNVPLKHIPLAVRGLKFQNGQVGLILLRMNIYHIKVVWDLWIVLKNDTFVRDRERRFRMDLEFAIKTTDDWFKGDNP